MPEVVITRYHGEKAKKLRDRLHIEAEEGFDAVDVHEIAGVTMLAINCKFDAPRYIPPVGYQATYRTVK